MALDTLKDNWGPTGAVKHLRPEVFVDFINSVGSGMQAMMAPDGDSVIVWSPHAARECVFAGLAFNPVRIHRHTFERLRADGKKQIYLYAKRLMRVAIRLCARQVPKGGG